MEINFLFRIRISHMGDGEYVTSFSLSEFWNGLHDITMIKEPQAWSNFSTELEDIKILQRRFQVSKISYIPLGQNLILDSLIRTARSFHSELCFISCSIPVLLVKSP